MRRAWLIALCGCRSILGIEGASPIDAPRDGNPGAEGGPGFEDAPRDAPSPGQICLGQAKVKVCVDPPTQDRVFASMVLDTSTGCTFLQPQAGSPALCVIVARDIIVPVTASLRVVGSRPLLLVASETITIEGKIDAASYRGNGSGAGANTGSCSTAAAGTNGTGGGGGGAGGALGFTGGAGGAGGSGTGGGTTAKPATTIFRGGCAGAKGGDSQLGIGGAGGAGGGAVYLLAGISVRIAGTINASGAGAAAPGARGGGGGGGAGGMIGIEAMMIDVGANANVYAVGGGGASGGGASTAGNAGAEAVGPEMTASAPPNGTSGLGGVGSATGSGDPGGVGSSTTGGGGGGGSAGIIWTFPQQPFPTGKFAPSPTLP